MLLPLPGSPGASLIQWSDPSSQIPWTKVNIAYCILLLEAAVKEGTAVVITLFGVGIKKDPKSTSQELRPHCTRCYIYLLQKHYLSPCDLSIRLMTRCSRCVQHRPTGAKVGWGSSDMQVFFSMGCSYTQRSSLPIHAIWPGTVWQARGEL